MTMITKITNYIPSVSREVVLPGYEIGTPRIENNLSMGDMAVKSSQKLLATRPDLKDKNLVVVVAFASLSGDVYGSIGTRLQHELGLKASTMTMQVTGGCYVSLQAVEMANSFLNGNKSLDGAIVVAVDNFSRFVSEKTKVERPSSLMWGDGAATVLIERDAKSGLALKNFASLVQGDAWFDCTIELDEKSHELEWAFAQTQDDLYKDDIKISVEVSNKVIAKENLKSTDLKGMVLLNRSRRFATKLAQGIGVSTNKVYESFKEIGHIGCVDLFVNLKNILNQNELGNYLVYSCGYGYTRYAGVVEKV